MSSATQPRGRGLILHALLRALAGSLLACSAAMAQSTGSQTVQEVVVTGHRTANIEGLISTQEAPKTKSVITQAYIATQQPGQNVLQDLNLTPGLNYTNDDPYGQSGGGGHLRIRGLDGSRISLLVDGVPLNDTGNYAIYGGELLDPEIVSQTNVNVGSTDVDSPTASAVGGLININSLTPTDTRQGFINASIGEYSYKRISGLFNTGAFGPFGTKAWIEGSDQGYDKFKGFGQLRKWQVNAKIYQDLHHEGDFVSLAFFYDSQRQNNIYGLNFATTGAKATPADAFGTDYLGQFFSTPPTPGAVGSDGVGLPAQGGNFYGNQINPTDTYNIRGQSLFTLLPGVHLTFDPSFQSVLADGGGQARTIAENDPRLIGTATVFKCPFGQKGVDLNGDGDCLDTVRVFLPSLTHTQRYTVNTSLIWDINPDHLIRISYALDHGHHRQTGGATYLDAAGFPLDVFGGYGGAVEVLAADGSLLRQRDRLSIAELNQYSAEYVGKFLDQHLRLDLGVRDPHFSRDLNQYCYTSSVNGSGVLCDTATPPPVGATAQYTVAPFHAHVSYTKVLPNAGLSWRFNAANMIYASYSEELSAPRTDSLYTVKNVAGAVNIDTVRPETSSNIEVGYRYQAGPILATVSAYDAEFRNRIITAYDPSTNLNNDRNVGSVQFYGVDAQLGARPLEHMTAVANFSYEHSRLKDNLLFDTAGDVEMLAGKQQIETPQIQLSGRATYEIFPDMVVGLQGKYVGSRYVTDLNDLRVAGYTTFDLDVRYSLDRFLPRSFVQLNVQNFLDKRYYGSLNSNPTINTNLPFFSGIPYAAQGGPRTISVSLRAAF